MLRFQLIIVFTKYTLENGLRILTIPMRGTNTITALVLCGTGSDYESREIGGISHFLEHMFFKGTKNRPNPEIIKHELDGMGSVSNAFTSHEITGYHVKAAKTYLDRSLDLLSDIYKNSLLDVEEINRERQVIIEEMHRDRDTPTLYIWWVWENLLWGDQPAGWDVIGEEHVIRALSRSDFSNYFLHQYVSSNTAVVLAGNFDETEAVEKVKNLFSDIRTHPPIRRKPDLLLKNAEPGRVKIFSKETDQTHLAIGFFGYQADHPMRYAADILATILGGSWSSRMWDRIREKLGLAYTVVSAHESYSNRGYLVTYAGVDHVNVEKTIQAALEEYKKITEEPVPAEELARVKDYIRGTTLIGLEQSNAMANFVGMEEMITGKPLTLDEVFAKIEGVTADDILRVSREIITPQNLRLALIGPFNNSDRFEKLLTL